MKILLIPDSYFPRLGGAEVYTYKLALFLKKEGHEVTLITPEQGEYEKDTEFPVYRLIFSKNALVFIRSMILYVKLVKEHDIVHAVYSHKMAMLGGIIAFFFQKKLVITEQGMGILDLPDNSWVFARIHELYRSFSIKLCYRFIASCREFVDIAKRYTSHHKKITYQPNSVDTDEFSPRVKNYSLLPFVYGGEPLIFIVRRMVPKNGVQFLVEATPKILEKIPNAKIVHIGWGRLEEYLKLRVEELKIENNFYFLNRIENTKLKDYLNLADVVVFPSTAEATSIACLESMALGKAIIASKVGGFPEMVEDGKNGYLVNLTDSEFSDYNAPMTLPDGKLQSLADAIVQLVSRPENCVQFGAYSRERAIKEFSWQTNIKKIVNWYTASP